MSRCVGVGFEQIAQGPRPQNVLNDAAVVALGKNDHLGGRATLADLPRHVRSVQDRQGVVHDRDIRRGRDRLLDSLLAVCGVGNHLPIGLLAQQCTETRSHNMVVISDENGRHDCQTNVAAFQWTRDSGVAFTVTTLSHCVAPLDRGLT